MTLDHDTASAMAGEAFTIKTDAGEPAVLTLVSVDRLGGDSPREGGPFAMLFETVRGPSLAQQTCRLERGEGEALDVFLVPLGPGEAGMRYEAVFS